MNELQAKAASIIPSLAGQLASVLSFGGMSGSDWDVRGYKDWRDTQAHSFSQIKDCAESLVKREIGKMWSAETLLQATLGDLTANGMQADPVIVYAIACCDQIEAIKTNYEQSAVTAFEKAAEFYGRLFGDLLPTKLAELRAMRNARKAYHTGTHATAAQDWPVYGEIFRAQCRQPLQGLSTGLPTLDGALGGGMSGLTLLAGFPGGGKTSLALKFITAALHHHPDVAALYVQLDSLKKTVMYDRLFCSAAKIPYRSLKVQPYAADVLERLEAAHKNLCQTVLPRLRIVGRPHMNPADEPESIDAHFLRKCCNALLRASGASRIMIVVDYLGLMDAPQMSPTSLDADDYRIGQIYEARRNTDDTYLVITEVTKAAGEVLTGADIKGSISKQYGADRILLLEPDRYSDSRGPEIGVNLRIVKSRDGTDRITVPLTFNFAEYTFTEVPAKPAKASRALGKTGSGGNINPMAGIDED